MSRRWIFAPLLAAAVAAPAVLMDKKGGTETQNENGDFDTGDFTVGHFTGGDFGANDYTAAISAAGGNGIVQADPRLDRLTADEAEMLNPNSISYAPGARDFREVFRFDANPAWLQKNWPLVTRSQSLDGLASYRVPLVTGPNPNDLTGALTYYFNNKNVCERISFYGFTADASRVIQLGTETFGLKADKNFGSGIYTSQFGRKVRSVLVIENPAIILKDEAQPRIPVMIELNNPYGKYSLSPETQGTFNNRSGLSNADSARPRIR